MFANRIAAVLIVASAVLWTPSSLNSQGASSIKLSAVSSVRCTFSLMAVGTWTDKPKADIKPANLELQFDAVNADEGSAQLKSGVGAYDIIVRYAQGYLHFIQSFRDGPVRVTTILEKETTPGKLRAMHSRHEYTSFALPTYTSSPEQYYGECEVLKAN